jgi:hypothetical protein
MTYNFATILLWNSQNLMLSSSEHILILILPFYMIHTGRYLVLPASVKMAMFSFALYGLYHCPLIHVVALKSTININYIFTPPPSKCDHM